MAASREYLPRLLDRRLGRLLAGVPAVLLVGPRASGKTTSCARHADTIVRLDVPSEARALAADPDAVLADIDGTILIDEWQLVPEVLPAVKRAVDLGAPPGRFVLTGSAQADLLVAGWAATGRIVRATQWGLCLRELRGDVGAPSFFDLAFGGRLEELHPPAQPPDLAGYVDLALAGGFPEAVLSLSATVIDDWLESYVSQLVTRDAAVSGTDRDPLRLRRYLQAVAANTAGLPEHKTLTDAAGIARMTGLAYDSLLDLVMVVEQIPAWSTNRISRLVKAPKRVLTDGSLLRPLLNVSRAQALRDGDLLGRLIETFVIAQLRSEREIADGRPTFWHLRTANARHEVDLVAETPDGSVVAIEIKASSAPDRADARHLAWLRDELADRFAAGVVFHTGPRRFQLDDRIWALPIATLWGDHRPQSASPGAAGSARSRLRPATSPA